MTHGPQVDAGKDSRQKVKETKIGNILIGKLQWRPGNRGETGPGPKGAVVHVRT